LEALALPMERLITVSSSLGRDAVGAARERLYGHTLRGRVCPYETEYGNEAPFRQGQELADLQGFYIAFGLKPPMERGERADHVTVELEFAEFLARKEAHAAETGDAEMLAVTRQAMGVFLEHHLGRFGPAFAAMLQREDPDGLAGRLGGALAALLALDARRLEVPIGPALLPVAELKDDAVPMGCGSCEMAGPPRE
jgi:TorA maturation chaperone TorD